MTTTTSTTTAPDRAAISRRNAQPGIDPRTAEAKDGSGFEAVQHGLSARSGDLPRESAGALGGRLDAGKAVRPPQDGTADSRCGVRAAESGRPGNGPSQPWPGVGQPAGKSRAWSETWIAEPSASSASSLWDAVVSVFPAPRIRDSGAQVFPQPVVASSPILDQAGARPAAQAEPSAGPFSQPVSAPGHGNPVPEALFERAISWQAVASETSETNPPAEMARPSQETSGTLRGGSRPSHPGNLIADLIALARRYGIDVTEFAKKYGCSQHESGCIDARDQGDDRAVDGDAVGFGGEPPERDPHRP
jgi:hypothetical protein